MINTNIIDKEVIMKGYVLKKSSSLVTKYNRRYLVLLSGCTLLIYNHYNDVVDNKECKYYIDLINTVLVKKQHDSPHPAAVKLQIYNEGAIGDEITLDFETIDKRDKWMHAIGEVKNNNRNTFIKSKINTAISNTSNKKTDRSRSNTPLFRNSFNLNKNSTMSSTINNDFKLAIQNTLNKPIAHVPIDFDLSSSKHPKRKLSNSDLNVKNHVKKSLYHKVFNKELTITNFQDYQEEDTSYFINQEYMYTEKYFKKILYNSIRNNIIKYEYEQQDCNIAEIYMAEIPFVESKVIIDYLFNSEYLDQWDKQIKICNYSNTEYQQINYTSINKHGIRKLYQYNSNKIKIIDILEDYCLNIYIILLDDINSKTTITLKTLFSKYYTFSYDYFNKYIHCLNNHKQVQINNDSNEFDAVFDNAIKQNKNIIKNTNKIYSFNLDYINNKYSNIINFKNKFKLNKFNNEYYVDEQGRLKLVNPQTSEEQHDIFVKLKELFPQEFNNTYLYNIPIPVNLMRIGSYVNATSKNMYYIANMMDFLNKNAEVSGVMQQDLKQMGIIVGFHIGSLNIMIASKFPFVSFWGESYSCRIGEFDCAYELTIQKPPIVNYYISNKDKSIEYYGYKVYSNTISNNRICLQDTGKKWIKYNGKEYVILSYPSIVENNIINGDRHTIVSGRLIIHSIHECLTSFVLYNPDQGTFSKKNSVRGVILSDFNLVLSDKLKTIDWKGLQAYESQIIASIGGNWTDDVYIKTNEDRWSIFKWSQMEYAYQRVEPEKREYVLPSDSSRRKDIYYLSRNNFYEAEVEKQKIEKIYARDMEMRIDRCWFYE